MRNIHINEAETIFEPFWDSGDTYPNHQKYSCMEKYSTCGDGHYEIGWNGVYVFSEETFTISRDLELDIAEFDRLIFSMVLPEGMTVKVRALIDGVNYEVINSSDNVGELEGGIKGNKLTHIDIEFIKSGDLKTNATLYWLGLANSKKRDIMLKRDNGYSPDCWDGCFNDDFEIKPHLSVFFDNQELEVIREKVKTDEFSEVFKKLEEGAKKALSCEPEKYIGDYIQYVSQSRIRETGNPFPRREMAVLAFVGLVNKDKQMLKMACRIALSAACVKYWCEGIRGTYPGATWHHRSFLEEEMSVLCAKVLDWAGEALTWHGRNIIYDAIIMKGIPRIEADIHTMDYIWHMNQGIVFTSSLCKILLVLGKRYPRYLTLVDRYEEVLCEMWSNYANADGGASEGPAYWDYSASHAMMGMYYLAKNKGMELAKYVPQSFRDAEKYAKGMLSTVGEGIYNIPLNDTPTNRSYDLLVPAFFSNIGEDKAFWAELFKKTIHNINQLVLLDELIIMSKNMEFGNVKKAEEYIPLIDTGLIKLVRNTEDLGEVALFVQGGMYSIGHEHEDKGSFVIEANNEGIIIDRGSRYTDRNSGAFETAKWHNVLYPELGTEMHQVCGVPDCYGKFLKYEYKNGVFECAVDVSSAWDGVFKKNIRTIISPNPNLFIIHDSVECDCDVSFRLNTCGKITGNVIECDKTKMFIHPLNWSPYKEEAVSEGTDGRGVLVNQLRMYGKSGELVTILELSDEESKVIIEDKKIKYDNTIIDFDNGMVSIREA